MRADLRRMLNPEQIEEVLEDVASACGSHGATPQSRAFQRLREHVFAMEARAKAAEDMLLSFTPSGSEYFLRHGDGFRVDIYECERVIREERRRGHEARIAADKLSKAEGRQP